MAQQDVIEGTISLTPGGQRNWVITDPFHVVSLLNRITTFVDDGNTSPNQERIGQYNADSTKRWELNIGNSMYDVYYQDSASDGFGNVFYLFYLGTSPLQYVVGGIDANGKEIWSQDFPADSSSIAADTAGDLYLLSEPHDATAVDLSAYSSSGAVRWTRSFSGGYPKMSVEQDGDVVLVGDILDNNCNAVRLDKNGNELWRTAFSVGEFGTGSDVFLAGDGSKRLDIGYNDYQDQFYPIIQIDSDGHILWQNQVSDRMDGISACQDGGVIACRSERIDDSTMRFHTIKFSSQGDEVFDSNFDTQADANDPWGGAFFGYAADRFGNTYVRAVTCVSAGFDQCFQYQSTVVKYDEYGNEVWTVEVRSIPEGPSGDSREFSNTLGTLATNNSAPSSILSSEAVYFVSPMGAFALSPDLRPTFDYDDDSAGDDDTTVDDDSDDDSSHSSGGDNSGCGC